MEVMQVLHMNEGEGETSYAKNSSVQQKLIATASSIVEEAVVGVLSSSMFLESLGIADLGCSSGPNAFMITSQIIAIVNATCSRQGHSVPELSVSLNDLPGNDFNWVFKALPEFYKKLEEERGGGIDRCFVSGMPGSFYGRLFPRKSLHFVHSSSSLHWLSQVPPGLESEEGISLNKGKLYLSKTSQLRVVEAYSSQFRKDFSLFLNSRAEEMVPGGRMVLSFMGRIVTDPTTEQSCFQWELLAHALMSLASEGLVEEEKIDSFNAPYYAPSPEELKCEVQREGLFLIDRLETHEFYWEDQMKTEFEELSSGQRVAKTVRAVVESMLEVHFGREIMDVLFRRYGELVDNHLSRNRTMYIDLVVSLIRKR